MSAAIEAQKTDVIDLRAAFSAAGIKAFLATLDRDLVGLKPVKARIREIASLLLVERVRQRPGFTTDTPTLHMSFTGNPGTGKTTVVRRMARILKALGFVRQGQLISVTRDDPVGQYIDHTAPKTKEILKKAIGGVLFIDEAYDLYRPDNERDYGQEAIESLPQVMETQREDLVVILAGYADRMEKFFTMNPGFHSRIAHHIDFPDYDSEQLLSISETMLGKQHYHFTPEAREAMTQHITARPEKPYFSNARSIRNALDSARLRQAGRLTAQNGAVRAAALMEIEAADILSSRVFQKAQP